MHIAQLCISVLTERLKMHFVYTLAAEGRKTVNNVKVAVRFSTTSPPSTGTLFLI
jgi:hypothetical protein